MEDIAYSCVGDVARLRFARPDRLNSLDAAMAQAFGRAVQAAIAASVRVLLISGAGRSFMAGGDLRSFDAAQDKAVAAAAIIDPMHAAIAALADSDIITIVAAQGHVAGAGVSLVAMADLAVVAEDATFTMAYCRIGAVPDCGGSWALPRAVGPKAAMEMALFNEPLGASDALRLGLVNKVVASELLEHKAETMARRICAGPTDAQIMTKHLLRGSQSKTLTEQLALERRSFLAAATLPDFEEGVSAFLNRRTPSFSPRKAPE